MIKHPSDYSLGAYKTNRLLLITTPKQHAGMMNARSGVGNT